MTEEKKDEMKNEMKNRISMALKDPILQQGFEIICKNLTELEKDNRLLEQRGSDILKELLDKNKRCMELEKQNVELEKENEEMKKGLGCETCQIHLKYMELNNKINDLEQENAKME